MTRQELEQWGAYYFECAKLLSLWTVNASVVFGGTIFGLEQIVLAVENLASGNVQDAFRAAVAGTAMLYGAKYAHDKLSKPVDLTRPTRTNGSQLTVG